MSSRPATRASEAPPGAMRRWMQGLLEWLVTTRAPLIVLTTLVAASVGYLIEKAITCSPREFWTWGNVRLLVAGVVAAFLSAALWAGAQAQAVRRGVFIHAVAESRLPRHAGEDALLRAWVRVQWPRALVMPYLPVSMPDAPTRPSGAMTRGAMASEATGSEPSVNALWGRPGAGEPDRDRDWQDYARQLAQRIVDQAATAARMAPAARALTILPAGPPHLMVAAGAAVGSALRDDPRPLRLLADDTSTRRRAFVEHPLLGTAPSTTSHATEQPLDPKSAKEHVLLVLPRASHRLAVAAFAGKGLHWPSPAADEAEATARTGEWRKWWMYRRMALDVANSQVELHAVDYDDVIAEDEQAYRCVQKSIGQALTAISEQHGLGTIYLQGAGPASLMFAAGAAAAQFGWRVGSMPFEESPDIYRWSDRKLAPDVRGPYATPSRSALRKLPQTIVTEPWWRVLTAASVLAGVAVPVLAGAFAMLAEWLIASSQPELTPHDREWGEWWAVLMGAIAAIMLLVRARLLRRLDAPAVVISTNRSATGGLATRRIPIPQAVVELGREKLAEWITERYCDVVTALPDVADVTIDLTGVPDARALIEHRKFGLRKSLRGNRPPEFAPPSSGDPD